MPCCQREESVVKDFTFKYAGRPYTVTSETEDASKLKWWIVVDGEKSFLCDVTPGESQSSLTATATRYLRARRIGEPHRIT